MENWHLIYFKLTREIIKDQNRLLAEAAEAIDALNKKGCHEASAEDETLIGKNIKALIVLNRTSITAIARKAGVTREWVSLVVNGHKQSRRIREAIAQAVGKEVSDLWPNGNNKAA